MDEQNNSGIIDLVKAKRRREFLDQASDLYAREQAARVKRLMAVLHEPFAIPNTEESGDISPFYFFISLRALLSTLRRFAAVYAERPKELAAELRSIAVLLDELGDRNLTFNQRLELIEEIKAVRRAENAGCENNEGGGE